MIGKVNVSGGNSIRGLKIYQQTDEPSKKEGLWVKTEKKDKNIKFCNHDIWSIKHSSMPSYMYFTKDTPCTINNNIVYWFRGTSITAYNIENNTETTIALNSEWHYVDDTAKCIVVVEDELFILGLKRSSYKYDVKYNLKTGIETKITGVNNIEDLDNKTLYSQVYNKEIYIMETSKIYKYNPKEDTYTILKDNLAANVYTNTCIIKDDIYYKSHHTGKPSLSKYNITTNEITLILELEDTIQFEEMFPINNNIYCTHVETYAHVRFEQFNKFDLKENKAIQLNTYDLPHNETERISIVSDEGFMYLMSYQDNENGQLFRYDPSLENKRIIIATVKEYKENNPVEVETYFPENNKWVKNEGGI